MTQEPDPNAQSTTEWYFAIGKKRYGPLTRSSLAEYIGSGAIKRDTLIFAEGMDTWAPAIQVKELTPFFKRPRIPPIPKNEERPLKDRERRSRRTKGRPGKALGSSVKHIAVASAFILIPVTIAWLLYSLLPPDPETVIGRYIDAQLSGDHARAYALLSADDQATRPFPRYETEAKYSIEPFPAVLAHLVSYQIAEVETSGTAAAAVVKFRVPDLDRLGATLLFSGPALWAAFGDDSDPQSAMGIVDEKYKKGWGPFTEVLETYTLVKEGTDWRVFVDYAEEERAAAARAEREKEEKEKETEVERLLTQARDLRDRKQLPSALETYNKVLELDGEVYEAQRAKSEVSSEMEEISSEMEELRRRRAYMEHVELEKFRLEKGRKYSFGDEEDGVFGTIVNNGTKTLKEVEITVYFLDVSGKAISEASFWPVYTGRISFSGDNKPLKPNYVQDFGYSLKDHVPTGWSGRVRAKISDIEFDD